jgi:3-deoxy-D-manno-octulosonic acid kinase
MMNGRRVATAGGAILADAAFLDIASSLSSPEPRFPESLFEPQFWSGRGGISPVGGGRGAGWYIDHGTEHWVLRHYRRGGLMARVSEDRYLWAGERRVRAFAEYRLLAALAAQGMPIPEPVAARYIRQGPWYRCDLITRRLAGTASLSATLAAAPVADDSWNLIGSTIARLHRAGADHADLNAHNILLDGQGAVHVVDFDRGRIRRPGAWAARNLQRLHRSLTKIANALPEDRFSEAAWQRLLSGYAQRPAAGE